MLENDIIYNPLPPWPIFIPSMQVYFGASNKKSYGKKKACPFCLETFFPTATDRKVCVTQNQVRDKVLKLPENEKSEFMTHVDSCICDQMVGLDFHELA